MVANKRKRQARQARQRKQRKRATARRHRKGRDSCDFVRGSLPEDIIGKWQDAKIAEAARNRLGVPRPMISTEFKGIRYVAVGSRIYWGHWKTFMEFLFEYATSMLGNEWGTRELKKQFAEMHPLIQLYVKAREFQKKQTPGPDGFCDVVPSGALYAFIRFAYDLYFVGHNNSVQTRLLDRLRVPDQFQGARHEVFSAATCIRAGCGLEYEDEEAGVKKHVEFIATHKKTGQKVCVEAKSRHREGVLPVRDTQRAQTEITTVRIGQLLNRALNKDFSHPLVVFLDFNIPPSLAESVFQERKVSGEIKKLINQINKQYGEKDRFSLLVCTNHPFHYCLDDTPYPRPNVVGILSQNPELKVRYPRAILDIYNAATSYGKVPNEFPQGDPGPGRAVH